MEDVIELFNDYATKTSEVRYRSKKEKESL